VVCDQADILVDLSESHTSDIKLPTMSYLGANLANVKSPFDAHGVTFNFFEGWYYKFQSKDGTATAFCIPGIYHAPNPKDSHAFIMFWVTGMPHSYYYRYATEMYSFDKCSKTVRVGGSSFSLAAVKIELSASDVWIPTAAEVFRSLTFSSTNTTSGQAGRCLLMQTLQITRDHSSCRASLITHLVSSRVA
jgi:hypothetical protein